MTFSGIHGGGRYLTHPLCQDVSVENRKSAHRNPRDERRYALCRGLGFWELTFEGRHAVFKHEQGALYVVWLLLHPPPEPVHALALALEARSIDGQPGGAAEIIQQRSFQWPGRE